ncbi:sensor domain-containing diguanylate cyclase [Clostridium akagii]|uniref:sensor domain-containing diguanylate cyclase n=1 Tax=Clostridium akagii TaxID=91623 RepID=UPI00047A4968|nr:diguanylate cyclase [Clostridium akagii]
MKKVIILIVFAILVVIYPTLNKHNASNIKAVNGIINLNNYDFIHNGIVKLDGQWDMYNNKLLDPEKVKQEKTDKYLIIPSELKSQLNGKNTGYMTLRLRIYAPSKVVYGLEIKSMLSASKVWINGILQGSTGKVGKSYNDEKAIYLPTYQYFTSENGVIDIVIETSNYRDIFPVIDSMDLGLKDQIMNQFILNSSVDLIIIGSLFIIELLFLPFYTRLKNNKCFLYFSLLCVFVQLRCLFLNERIIIHFFPNMPFELLSKTAALTYYLWIPIYVLFLKDMYKSLSKKIVTLSWAFSIIFTIICLTTNNVFYDKLSYVSQAILTIIVIYLLIFLINKFREREKNSGATLLALIFLIITTCNDILVNNGAIYGRYVFQIGMFIFAFLETYALIIKYCDDLVHYEKLKIENQLIYEKSIRDSLTNLYNRNYIEKILDNTMENYRTRGEIFTTVMFDIDFFKSVNDTYGHPYGDKVLITISDLIDSNVKNIGYAGRYGGEEFIIILPDTNKGKAKEIAEKIRDSVSELAFKDEAKITISGGLYENDTFIKGECIKNADKLLYKAKENGRNRIEV